ncbi:MAG: citrate synthase/methylcitrate synthase [Chloroflexi bacterium]|nr:citrate synthase/methylcitrate synthase [Chloroflexota bacterium]
MLKQNQLKTREPTNAKTNPSSGNSRFIPGLEGVIAAQSRLSYINGQAGELIIAGFPVEEIAPRASFEEMTYLLWNDRLPNRQELDEFRARLAKERRLPAIALDVLKAAAAQRVPTMDALRMGAGTLSLSKPAPTSDDTLFAEGAALLARIPTMIAAYWRLLHRQAPIEPRPDLSHAANYLYMLSGDEPSPQRTRALDTYLNTVIDHGLNASTFTALVIISTGSDLVSAIVGAIGALKGPLHGGAPGPALNTVFEIGEASRAESVLRAKLDRNERLMGFGHRVYRARDPRADVLAAAAERLYQNGGDMALYNLAKSVEQTALRLLAEYHPERKLQTNVEFYTALVLHGLALPTDLFSPTFAASRTAGWIAHCEEQREQNKLIRPSSEYIGVRGRRWVPVEAR